MISDPNPTPLSPERAKEMAKALETIAAVIDQYIHPDYATELRQFAKELRNAK